MLKKLLSIVLTIVLLVSLTTITCQAAPPTIAYTNLGTDAPPAALDGYTLQTKASGMANFATATSLPTAAGAITLSSQIAKRIIPGSWSTWSHGYTGEVFLSATSTSLTMPKYVKSIIFYVEPSNFGSFPITVTANNDIQTQQIQSISGSAGASGFGFTAGDGGYITSISISAPSGANGFAIGELAVGIDLDVVGLPLNVVYDGTDKTQSFLAGLNALVNDANITTSVVFSQNGSTVTPIAPGLYDASITYAVNTTNGATCIKNYTGGLVITGSIPSSYSAPAPPPAPATQPLTVLVTTTSGTETSSSANIAGTFNPATETVSAVVSSELAQELLDKALDAKADGKKAVARVQFGTVEGASSVDVELPRAELKEMSAAKATLQLDSGIGTITLGARELNSIVSAAPSGSVSLSIEKVDKEDLSAKVQAKIKDSPIYRFEISVGDTSISRIAGSAQITLPYTPPAGMRPRYVTTYYIDSNNVLRSARGKYDAKTGTISLSISRM